MLRHKPRYSTLLALLASTLIIFQNCGDGLLATKTSNSAIDFGSQSELIYGHNGHLQFQKASTEAQPVYTNRMLTYNTFISVFGNSVKLKMVETIAWAASDVGSGWDLYQKRRQPAADCRNDKNPFYRCDNEEIVGSVANISGASAPREGRRMSACQIGVDSDKGLEHALKKIDSKATLEKPPAANSANFEKAFQLFFRGKPMPANDFFDALDLVHKQHEDKTEAWKQIVLGICLSPHWQVL